MGNPNNYSQETTIPESVKRLAAAYGLPLSAGKSNSYGHLIICNGDHSKPLGGPMCCCLNILKAKKES